MPDKPLETTWVGTTLLPTLRRGRRLGRRMLRGARSRVMPRTGVLGELPISLPAVSALAADAGAEVRRLDVVVFSVPPGSQQIPADYVEPLVHAEQYSVPTVLAVTGGEDIEHPLAAVVTHMVTTDPSLVALVEAFAGAERTAQLDATASASSQAAALRRLTRVHTPVAVGVR